jgi:hypothetical protein
MLRRREKRKGQKGRKDFFGFVFFTADFLAPFFALLPRSRTLSEFSLPMSALATC